MRWLRERIGARKVITYPDANLVQIVSIVFAAQWAGSRFVPDLEETLAADFFAPDALPPVVAWYKRLLHRTLTAGPAGVFE